MTRDPAPPAILLVEDEPLIAMLVEDYFDLLGYRVAAQADCLADAAPLVEAGGFDAALLDVNLREGEVVWPLADRLAERGIPFVLATGGDGHNVPPRHAAAPVLAKPYTLDEMKAVFGRVFADDN
ncbi:response regulator [Sphingomonas flavalba]|uniref:response regulator n=1 Tax=Sphingomonas flavalba TaxID=2559804 RepID=UPI0039DFABAD